jgi:hypothetical protein
MKTKDAGDWWGSPGIGPVSATAMIVAIDDGGAFHKRREHSTVGQVPLDRQAVSNPPLRKDRA